MTIYSTIAISLLQLYGFQYVSHLFFYIAVRPFLCSGDEIEEILNLTYINRNTTKSSQLNTVSHKSIHTLDSNNSFFLR